MANVSGINLCHSQTDGRLNLNFSYDNFSAPNHHKFDNVKPDITPHRPSPKYPQFNSLPVRLSTFHQWPLRRPEPLQLAQAGLYYLGSKDRTVCYYCGGGLSSWEQDDDPEIEHERLFPHCELVKRKNQSDHSESTQSSSQYGPISVPKQILFQDQSREDPMKSAAVQSLIEFGYTLENVKKAVDRLTMEKGKNVFSAKELMEILDRSEDKEESNKRSSDIEISEEFQTRAETVKYVSKVKPEQVENHNKLDPKFLMEENLRLRDLNICKICMDHDSCIVFLPCGHMVCCAACAPAMRKCPICRELVRGTVKAFMA